MMNEAEHDRGTSPGSEHEAGPGYGSQRQDDGSFDEREHRDRRQQRKERVLHTRISEQLARDIRQMAEDLRVPVSNLVRNVLEEAFSAVESVSDDVGDLLEDVIEQAERASDRIRQFQRQRREREHREARRAEPPESEAFAEVEAWQPVILNASRRCDADGREIRRGEQAFVGLTASGLSATTLCPTCLESRR